MLCELLPRTSGLIDMNLTEAEKDVLRKQLWIQKTKLLQAKLQPFKAKLKRARQNVKTKDEDVPKVKKRSRQPMNMSRRKEKRNDLPLKKNA